MKKLTGSKSGIKFFTAGFFSLMLVFSLSAASFGPGIDQSVQTAVTPIKAVVVRSWGGCSSGSLPWGDLNANWSTYGSLPISINFSNPALCAGLSPVTITYANLVASGANVVILENPAGGNQQYSTSEIAALKQYAQAGHDLIGTYATFEYASTYNNAGLAPLFGLPASITFDPATVAVTPTYSVSETTNLLFTGIGSSYASGGYAQSQVPTDGVWGSEDLNGARFVAKTSDNLAAITVYDQGKYHAIFISSMAEYTGNAADEQFFYNAITYTQRSYPSTPSLVTPANNALVTNYKPTLDWTDSTVPSGFPAFSHYQLQVANNSAFTGAVTTNINGITNSKYTFTTALVPNTKTYWRVRSFNTAGKSSNWSAVRSFRTAILPPSLSSPGIGAHAGSRKPTFFWNSVTGASSYSIEISTNAGFSALVGTYPASPTHYTPAANLPLGTLYWRVQALGANGPSNWSAGRKVIIP